jgi:preprotein translocase subunit SecG
MSTLLISLLTLILLLISVFVVMIVLMQRTSQSGGMGAALGGGAAESAFGSETNNILTKGTIYGIIAFFLIALGLYLLYQAQAADRAPEVDMNTLISADSEAASATDGGTGAGATGETANLEGTSATVDASTMGTTDEAPVDAAGEASGATESTPLPSTN